MAGDPQPDDPTDVPDDDTSMGTQPADPMTYDTLATMRPMATQAVFRPEFDDSVGSSVGNADTEPRDQTTMLTRRWSPIRRLGGGLVEVPRVIERDPLAALMKNPVVADPASRRRPRGGAARHRAGSAGRPHEESGGGRGQAVLLELRQAGGAIDVGRQGVVRGLVPALR